MDAIVFQPGEGDLSEREHGVRRILAELPEFEVIDMTFGFRNPGPDRIRVLNIHAPHAGFIGRMLGREE